MPLPESLDYMNLVRQFPTASRAIAERKAGRLLLNRIAQRLYGLGVPQDPQKAFNAGSALGLVWELHSKLSKEIRELEQA